MLLQVFIYLLVGSLAGVFAGLLGIGGGLIVVPALTLLLPWAGVPQQFVVHIAVATSLAIIVVTGSSSTWSHHKRGAVQWDYVKSSAPLLLFGVIVGVISTTHIPGAILAKIIAIVIFAIGLRMFFKKRPLEIPHSRSSHKEPLWRFAILNILFGSLSAMLGVGGGAFLVPYLNGKFHKTMQQAAATGSACAVMLGFVSAITYIATGWNVADLPPETLGYIYWPAFFAIGTASVFCAPLGVKWAHKLPGKQLRYIFACLLLIVAIKMAF